MRRKILVADLLCGAGGSSTGAIRALLGLGFALEDIVLACVNHWGVAMETHRRNYPEARHYLQDIATGRPHIIVPEGYLDLLMASPTCTHHSNARGGKPTSDQQRSDPWHIITWLTELRVKRIIIENVWEFINWGPVDPRTGKPIASRKGEYFLAWIETIKRLGFEPEWRKLNAADYGDATTRQRFILMARSDGRRVHWPMPTHRKREEIGEDLFAQEVPWRPAREIIDWGIRGRSIFGRTKPLAPKTLARILAGAIKFKWPAPFIALLQREIDRSIAYHIRWAFAGRNAKSSKKERIARRALVRSLVAWLRRSRAEPGAICATDGGADPMLVTLRRNGAGGDVKKPLPTIAANGTHIALAEPVVINLKKASSPYSPDVPLPTQTSLSAHISLAEPIISSRYGMEGAEPVPRTVVDPFILNRHGDGYGEARAHPVDQPTPTANCDGGGYLVEPFVLSQASGGSARAVSEPIPTSTTGGNGASHALISPYYGSGSGETCASAEEPLPTVTSKGRFGMVVPVTQSSGGPNARDVSQPIPTLTTAKGGEFAVVMPVTHHDGSDRVRDPAMEPLPTVTGANRGELACIVAQFGERDGQSPRVHDINEPTPTICATGRVNLAQATESYDILFRMLEPHELAAAMGFTTEDHAYEFAGTKTEQIKQIGNAVSVAKMKACVAALMADAAPRSKASLECREAAE